MALYKSDITETIGHVKSFIEKDNKTFHNTEKCAVKGKD